jgi:two-component system LytT family response regulator
VYVECGNSEFYTELTLKVLENRSPFVRCHKQFLVNIDHVDEIILGENLLAQITTKAGRSVPVSRRFLKKLKDKFGI